MPANLPMLADPPAEDLDSLQPLFQHASTWPLRRAGSRSRNHPRVPQQALSAGFGAPAPPETGRPSQASAPLETRLDQLEEVVRDCALLLRSSVVERLDQVEDNLANETARLDERLHSEARRRCSLLTEVTVKVSAAIDQLRREAKSPST